VRFGRIEGMKKLSFNLPLFEVTQQESEEYGMWVKMTAKLLDRPYFQLHRIFEKENWSLDEIRSAYNNAVKHHGSVSAEVAWWSSRKRRNKL